MNQFRSLVEQLSVPMPGHVGIEPKEAEDGLSSLFCCHGSDKYRWHAGLD
jgi:hypothetical protein